MSQEILFLLFMTAELVAIMALYTFWIIPRVALKTNNLFEERMLDKTWNIPAMLEDYTEHLLGNVDALFFGFTDEDGTKKRGKIQKFYEGAAGKAAQAMGKEGLPAGILNELSNEPWYVQAIAQKLLPSLQKATEGLKVASDEPAIAPYRPGLARR